MRAPLAILLLSLALVAAGVSGAAAAGLPPDLPRDSWVPNDAVDSVAQSGDQVFIGGDFSAVDGEPRQRVARIRPDKSVDPDFAPGVDGQVNALALAGPTLYGELTPIMSAGIGSGQVPVQASLTGLAKNTRYHFRLVATSSSGTTASASTFTTPSSVPGEVGPVSAPSVPSPGAPLLPALGRVRRPRPRRLGPLLRGARLPQSAGRSCFARRSVEGDCAAWRRRACAAREDTSDSCRARQGRRMASRP